MTKENFYTYIGANGSLTTSILIEGAPVIKTVRLVAAPGKKLTNGSVKVITTTVPANEVDSWTEIDA